VIERLQLNYSFHKHCCYGQSLFTALSATSYYLGNPASVGMNNCKQGIKAKETFGKVFFPSRAKNKYTPFPNISLFFTLEGGYDGILFMRSYRNRPAGSGSWYHY
jgi:hypothetical protein